jgi:hypothetical protein
VDPGPFIALAFASPAIIAAVGGIWLGAKFLNKWSERKDNLRNAIDRVEEEIADLHERLDFHERLLKEQHEREQLP